MSIYRKNMITNDWVIFAPNRARRPRELKQSDPDNIQILKDRPSYRLGCPFCPGNEEPDTEVFRLEHEGKWKIRIVRNRYSSVERGVVPERRQTPLFKEMDGFGIHDVIIDTPRHDHSIALFTQEELVDLLGAYQERAVQIKGNDPAARWSTRIRRSTACRSCHSKCRSG
jgi:UDPglucose--hexose-1-phosphate uridylyltransferase